MCTHTYKQICRNSTIANYIRQTAYKTCLTIILKRKYQLPTDSKLVKKKEAFNRNINCNHTILLLLPGVELSLIAESFGLLNDLLLPFLSILDESCPIFYLHLTNVLFDVILPSVLGSSLWSFGQGFPIKFLLNCSGMTFFACDQPSLVFELLYN